jgi:hypothetical protein
MVYVALFAAVLAEQFGLPVPAAPFLIAAGALAGLDRLSPAWALTIATSASLISDYTWFHLGKIKGSFILKWLGKRCPEPQSCAIKVQSTYSRYGPRSILVSKFVRCLTFLLHSWRAHSGWRRGSSSQSTQRRYSFGRVPTWRWAGCSAVNWSRSAHFSNGLESSWRSR